MIKTRRKSNKCYLVILLTLTSILNAYCNSTEYPPSNPSNIKDGESESEGHDEDEGEIQSEGEGENQSEGKNENEGDNKCHGCKKTFIEPCENNTECENGHCISFCENETICTRPCADDCPIDWDCRDYVPSGSDPVTICVPNKKLCASEGEGEGEGKIECPNAVGCPCQWNLSSWDMCLWQP